MSRVKHSALSDPQALPKSHDPLDSASTLTFNTVARASRAAKNLTTSISISVTSSISNSILSPPDAICASSSGMQSASN